MCFKCDKTSLPHEAAKWARNKHKFYRFVLIKKATLLVVVTITLVHVISCKKVSYLYYDKILVFKHTLSF
jgi:hypothetical protein